MLILVASAISIRFFLLINAVKRESRSCLCCSLWRVKGSFWRHTVIPYKSPRFSTPHQHYGVEGGWNRSQLTFVNNTKARHASLSRYSSQYSLGSSRTRGPCPNRRCRGALAGTRTRACNLRFHQVSCSYLPILDRTP